MRAKIFMVDGTTHDIMNCKDGYNPSTAPNILTIITTDSKYHFNMDYVEYVQTFMEDENDENA